jgi:transposase-like protein
MLHFPRCEPDRSGAPPDEVIVGLLWLSPTTITRLKASWETEYHAWRTRSVAATDYVYVWVDCIRVCLEEDRVCTFVIIRVRPDRTKELLAVEDGYRE